MTPMDEFASDARQWARQTIIFTMQYGLVRTKTDAEEQAQLTKMSKDSAEVSKRLWAAAAKGSPGVPQTVRAFARLVLEWSAANLPVRKAVDNTEIDDHGTSPQSVLMTGARQP
jgi:hypothetical protein